MIDNLSVCENNHAYEVACSFPCIRRHEMSVCQNQQIRFYQQIVAEILASTEGLWLDGSVNVFDRTGSVEPSP